MNDVNVAVNFRRKFFLGQMGKCQEKFGCAGSGCSGGGGGVAAAAAGGGGGGGMSGGCSSLELRPDKCHCRSWKTCASQCTKLLLIIFNFIFLAIGVTLIVLGFWMYVDHQSFIYTELLFSMPAAGPLLVFDRLPFVFICSGCFVATLSFLGCCGACSDSVCFLSLYSVLLFLILAGEIVLSILAAVFQNQLLLNLQQSMQYQITHEYNRTAKLFNETRTRTSHITAAWDVLQTKMNCCGATSYRDYKFSMWFNQTRNREEVFVPPSCCVLLNDDPRDPWIKDEDDCQIDAILYQEKEGQVISKSLKSQGCQWSVMRWLRARILIVIAVISAGAIVQILHFVFACVLLAHVRRSHSDFQWFQEDC